jgi:HEAT repeat protein
VSRPGKSRHSSNNNADRAKIRSLIAALASDDGLERQHARMRLVAIGERALTPLEEALADMNSVVRWEAAKALGEIRDPLTAPALVAALEDTDFGVRWLAAEGLIGLRRATLTPLLKALAERGQFPLLREGARHVLRALCEVGLQDKIIQVCEALEGSDAESEVPLAARKALEEV